MPESISELSNERIAERINEILSDYAALSLNEQSSEEDISKAEQLAAEIKDLRALSVSRQEAAAALAARVVNVQDAFAEPEQVDEAPVVVDEAPAEPEVRQEEPVAAAAPPRSNPVRRAAAHAPEVKIPEDKRGVVVTAAADVPGFSNGSELDGMAAATEAIVARMRGLPTHHMPDTRLRFGAAVIRRTGYGDLVQRSGDDDELLKRAADTKRLPGGNLTAAGGWCAPSETLYDLCQDETLDGILSVPEIQVTRGGIRYSPGPKYSDIYNSASGFWSLTEAQAIAGTPTKTCYTIACPSPVEVRMDAVGLCIKVPILTNAGWPELTTRTVAGALVAHQHKMNVKVIGAIETAAGAAQVVPNQKTFLFNLDHLEWQAEAIRQSYALGINSPIETVLPTSAKILMRAELGRRTGVELHAVSDQQINEWFSVRNLVPQFVRDWQPLGSGHSLQAIPATIKVLMYPPGSWVKGVQDVINLDVVYDSTELVNNMYTGLFFEEGMLVVQRCLGTTLLSVAVCVGGATGALQAACMGTVAT